jgi:hypothetical protein
MKSTSVRPRIDLCPSSVVPLKVEIFVVPSARETGMWQVSRSQRSLKTGVYGHVAPLSGSQLLRLGGPNF